MKKIQKKLKRTAAFLLASLLVANHVDLPAFTTYAKAVRERGEHVLTITEFEALEEETANQTLAVGALEEEIAFPDTLFATAAASVSSSDAEERKTPANAGRRATESDADWEDGSEEDWSKISITGITWELDPEESDKEVFDSSEECDGYCYVYTPVLPKTDADGNSVILKDGVEVPEISVLVGERQICLIDEVGAFTVSGGKKGTDYSYEDGVLRIKTDTELTIKNKDAKTPTTDRIIVESTNGANITLAGVNIDVSSTASPAMRCAVGTTNIILEKDTMNKLKSGQNSAGLEVSADAGIVIDGTGNLEAAGGDNGAGIGGGERSEKISIEINGGTITANGGSMSTGIGGGCRLYSYSGISVKINGGMITATSGSDGSGIGSGGNRGGTVEISGGTVIATADYNGHGAGISSGFGSDRLIKISGGTITATGGYYGAGIGGYSGSPGGNIEISGGTITATSSYAGAGIGGGDSASGGNVVITGGNVKAQESEHGEAIGCGWGGKDSGTLKNQNDEPLSLYTLTLCGLEKETEISSINGVTYSAKDVKTLDQDKLYLYLPDSSKVQSVSLKDGEYSGIFSETATFHSYTYKADAEEKILNGACRTSDCDESVAIALSAPESKVYTGEAIEAKGTVDPQIYIPYKIDYEALENGRLTGGKPVNAGKYRAAITLDEQTICTEYEITKATPFIATLPNASAITYGQTLKDSVLTGGEVYRGIKTNPVDGTFAWEDASIKPVVADSRENNKTLYSVVFTPSDADNYETVKTTLPLTVQKSSVTPDLPGGDLKVPYSYKKVSDHTLKGNWIWSTEDAGKELKAGTPVTAEAVYNGEDKGNYVTESVNITITRSDCAHEEGDVLYTGAGEHAPDCENRGLGHTECIKCHDVMRTDISVPALGHHYQFEVTKEPTDTSVGIRTYTCTTCGHSYTETIDKLQNGSSGGSNGAGGSGSAGGSGGSGGSGSSGGSGNSGSSQPDRIDKPDNNNKPDHTDQPDRNDEKDDNDASGNSGKPDDNDKADHNDKTDHNITPDNNITPDHSSQTDSRDQTDSSAQIDNDVMQKNDRKPESFAYPDQTGEPYIAGKESMNGWEKIKVQLNSAEEKVTITVDMNSTTIVPGYIFDTIKGKDVNVVFDIGNGVFWTVNGKDVAEETIHDIDFGVKTGEEAGTLIPTELIDGVVGENASMNLSLSYEGPFGFKAVLTLNAGKENAGLLANLFYYHPDAGKLEYICTDEVDEEGNVQLEFEHASDYVIVIDKKDTEETGDLEKETLPSVPETAAEIETIAEEAVEADSSWLPILGALAVIGLCVFFAEKKYGFGKRK